MGKKLKLEGLKVRSFVTEPEQSVILGGATKTACQFPTCNGYVTCQGYEDPLPQCARSNFTCHVDTCSPSCMYCCMSDPC